LSTNASNKRSVAALPHSTRTQGHQILGKFRLVRLVDVVRVPQARMAVDATMTMRQGTNFENKLANRPVKVAS